MSYFFRQLFHFEKFDESKVHRGKTTPESTPGSFAPNPRPADEPTKTVVRRTFKEATPNPAADKQVAESDTPAQTMRDQFGPLPSQEQVLAELQSRVTPEQWALYVKHSEEMSAAMAAAGGDTEKQWAVVLKKNGETDIIYDPERRKLHEAVATDYVRQYVEAASNNTSGQAELVVLAGRGGSGKSSFGPGPEGAPAGKFFTGFYGRNAVVVDPDEVKKDLYAASVESGRYPKDVAFDPRGVGSSYWHEESSHVTKIIQQRILGMAARGYKADVVFDLTLASNKGKLVGQYKDAGFATSVANMNIPVVESATQALRRHLTQDENGRYGRLVPIEVIANSRDNERNFDTMLKMKSPEKGLPIFDSWHIYTLSHVGPPREVAMGGKRRRSGT